MEKHFENIPENWQIVNLEKLGKCINGLTYSPDDIRETGSLVLRSSNVQNDFITYEDNVYVREDLRFNPTQKGDVLICVRNGSRNLIGKTARITERSANNAFGAFMTIYRSTENDFLNYFFKSSFFFREVHRNLGATINSINNTDLLKFKVPLPSEKERVAIANCLSTWDEAIEKQTKLIAAKEQRKKALMQQLLSGKKRLPGFTETWKNYTLGSLGSTFNGLTGKNKEDFGEGQPFITYLNIFQNPVIDISTFDLVKINLGERQNRVKYGDIFFTVSSETQDEVGMASVLLQDVEDLYLNSFCFGYRLHNFDTLLPEFSSYFFRAYNFRKELFKLSQGATRYNLSKNNLMLVEISVPNVKEQKLISDILFTAEKEISAEKIRLVNFKRQKKALMQNLLSGKVRLVS